MKKTPVIKANNISISGRKLILGAAVNDADYMVNLVIDGVRHSCPYYVVWYNMLRRTLSDSCKDSYPTYKDCTVCDEWLRFSVFKEWMMSQDWEDKFLDKDIINPGNKEYCPEFCCFVTRAVNNLLTNTQENKGLCPMGVHEQSGTYVAQINIENKRKYLGRFDCKHKAGEAYRLAKKSEISRQASMQADSRIAQGLIRHADRL